MRPNPDRKRVYGRMCRLTDQKKWVWSVSLNAEWEYDPQRTTLTRSGKLVSQGPGSLQTAVAMSLGWESCYASLQRLKKVQPQQLVREAGQWDDLAIFILETRNEGQ